MTPEKILAPSPDAVSHADDKLKRVIGPWGLGAAAVNIAVGAGIFVVPAFVAAILGPAAIVAYFVCGIAVALVLTCYIEIGSFVHRSGGGVAYVEEAFGPLMGFLAWVMYSVGYEVIACAALAVALIGSLAVWVPALNHGAARVLTLLVVFGGLAAVNIIGVRQGLRVAVASTIAKLVPLLLAVVAGIFFVHWHQLRWAGWPPAAKLGEASLILFFAFQGIEEALAPSAEIRDPARTVPRAMFGATGTVILLYVALQLVSQGVLGGELAHQTTAPLAAVAGRIVGVGGKHAGDDRRGSVDFWFAGRRNVVDTARVFSGCGGRNTSASAGPSSSAISHATRRDPHGGRIDVSAGGVRRIQTPRNSFQCVDFVCVPGHLPGRAEAALYAQASARSLPRAGRPVDGNFGFHRGDLAAVALDKIGSQCAIGNAGALDRILLCAAMVHEPAWRIDPLSWQSRSAAGRDAEDYVSWQAA